MSRQYSQSATCLSLYCLTIFVLHLACRLQDQVAFLYTVPVSPTQLSAVADVPLFVPQQFVRRDRYN